MKINNTTATNVYMNSNVTERDKSLSKIATAIQLQMEDSSARSIASMLQTQVSTATQGLMNVNDGISMMQIADGALQSLSDQTQTLNELSVRYNSASLNDSQKSMLQAEFNDTLGSMAKTIETTTFNGKALLGSSLSFSTGNGTIDASIGNVDPSALSIDNQQSIQNYQNQLSSVRSDIGSSTNAFISNANTLLAQITSTASARSQIADTDMAQATQNFQQQDLKLNASQLALAHQNDVLRKNIMSLLG